MPVLRLGERLFAAPPPGTTLCCPGCGNNEVGSADVILATADGGWCVGADGLIEFDGNGNTVVHWDSQEVADEARECFCQECNWEGGTHELVTAERYAELTAVGEWEHVGPFGAT